MSAGGEPTITIGKLGMNGFGARLREQGLGVRLGPFDVCLRTRVDAIYEPLFRLYRDYEFLEGPRVFNMHVSLDPVSRWPRAAKVRLVVDSRAPHEDMVADQALAVLEWGLNLVTALRSHAWLMLHSAAVERGGRALLLPAWPGAGKTTLCVALAHRGWRLFSDEFGLVRPSDAALVPLPRPMPIKNASIDVIRAFVPEAEFGPVIANTRKGTIVHVKAPENSIRRASEVATVRWIVFPKWRAGAPLELIELPKSEAFATLATNAFNYEIVGEAAFEAVRQLVSSARCFSLVYSDLEQSVRALDRLAAEDDDEH